MPKPKPQVLFLREVQTEESYHKVELSAVGNIYRLSITNNGTTTTVAVPDHSDSPPPFTHARQ